MAITFKPTNGLNVFALQYVNSQCQHDSLSLKLATKLHLFTETSKFATNYFDSCISVEVQIRSAKGTPGCALALNMKNAPGSAKRQGAEPRRAGFG